MLSRNQKIDEILSFLETKKNEIPENFYAVSENIRFFHNIRRFRDFRKWYKKHQNIDSKQLLELTDFENEKYSRELHEELIKVEKRKIPGLIMPLVNRITNYILSENRVLIAADLGSGSMELTRQIIENLQNKKFSKNITFVAYDQSKASHETALRNLRNVPFQISILELNHCDFQTIQKLSAENTNQYTVILCFDDIFSLPENGIKFDFSYHSFFKHHLNETNKNLLDKVMLSISEKCFEYDGFYSSFGLLIQAVYTWKNPNLLNGAVFSTLRYPKKTDLLTQTGIVKIYKKGNLITWRGTYLREF
jgi:hypothetical protein